ncbi:MAG TPA: hypothetical protein VK507_20705, partial [Iamia sp.]|nr:hypothetical protein [Iamia sp.]
MALSGGGHRAACWGAGALLGLVDADASGDVVSVSSVSGGSIANGVVGRGGDLRIGSREAVEGWLGRGLQQWGHVGLFFPGAPTDRWVVATLGLVALALATVVSALAATVAASRDWAMATVGWVALGLTAAMAGLVLWKVWSLLPRRSMEVAVLAGALATGPLSVGAVLTATRSAWWLMVPWAVGVILLAVATRRFGGRSAIAADGLAATTCPGTLDDLRERPVHHVFCATNLRTGNNLYLSNRLTWGSPGLAAEVGSTTLATAVQASACLPGAFLARTLDIEGHTVVLSDGGVYDNMADQWEWGYPNRVDYAADTPGASAVLAAAQAEAATHLVVVNASRGMEGTDDKLTRPGLSGEMTSALGAKDVLYDVSTATRRRILIDMFDRAGADPDNGPGGMLVHIGTSPYTVLDGFAGGTDASALRAAQLLPLLDQATDLDAGTTTQEERRRHWKEVADANSVVPTTLAPLESIEPGSTARLLHHAWVLTR